MIFSTSKQLLLVIGSVASVVHGADLRGNNNNGAVVNSIHPEQQEPAERGLQSGFEIRQALQMDQMECRDHDDRDGSVVCQFRTTPPALENNVKKVYDCFRSNQMDSTNGGRYSNYCLSTEIQRESVRNVPSSAGGMMYEETTTSYEPPTVVVEQPQLIEAEVNQMLVPSNLQQYKATQKQQQAGGNGIQSGVIKPNISNDGNCPATQPMDGGACANTRTNWLQCLYYDYNDAQNNNGTPKPINCRCKADDTFQCGLARGFGSF